MYIYLRSSINKYCSLFLCFELGWFANFAYMQITRRNKIRIVMNYEML